MANPAGYGGVKDVMWEPAGCGLRGTCNRHGAEEDMWEQVSSAPFDQDLELAVCDRDGAHALVFP